MPLTACVGPGTGPTEVKARGPLTSCEFTATDSLVHAVQAVASIAPATAIRTHGLTASTLTLR
jgi:hypothetical protein